MTNEETVTAAGLRWQYIATATQTDLTTHPAGEQLADHAYLYTEDDAALVVLVRMAGAWVPLHSELLAVEQLAAIPEVERVADLDVGLLLDAETDSLRSAR